MENLFAVFFEWELHLNSCVICRLFESAAVPTRSFFVVCPEGRALLMQMTQLIAELSRGSA